MVSLMVAGAVVGAAAAPVIAAAPATAAAATQAAMSAGAAKGLDLADAGADVRMNHVQVIGTHNSYKLLPEAGLMRVMQAADRRAGGIDYAHLPLVDQLNLGLRGLELDIYFDPDGGRYARPLGHRLVEAAGGTPEPFDPRGELKTPGFKIMHQADFDFRSTVFAFERALDTLAAWSAANPDHLPIVVTMNTQDGKDEYPGAVEPVRFDAAVFAELDRTLRERLGGKLLTPDRVRGDAETLESAVLTRGWPRLRDVRGMFLFVLDEGGATRATYLEGHPSLKGRAMFTTSDPGAPDAAFLVMNEPVQNGGRIRTLVEKGYFVRTRADAGTEEARTGDRTRFEAAMASGAQVISTDYPVPDLRRRPGFVVRFEGAVGFVRWNPVVGEAEMTR